MGPLEGNIAIQLERLKTMKYISVKDTAEKWKITTRTVRRYCEAGLIDGAFCIDATWVIPEDARKPNSLESNPPTPKGAAKQVIYQKNKNNHFGLYEFLQVNLAYSSSRMASNRLTRNQVIEIFRTGKVAVAFEPMKIDDVVEISNHFYAGDYMIDTMFDSLSVAYLRKIHTLLFYGTKADREGKMHPGELRKFPDMLGIQPENISGAVAALLSQYEAKREVTIDDVLDFHVALERIHPFEDGNGRLGRLIMMKECLRHQIIPFIIDDKQRGVYNRGIAVWDKNPDTLMDAVNRATKRMETQMDTCRLLQYCRPETGRGSQNGGKKK